MRQKIPFQYVKVFCSHLHRHFYQHEQLLNADPLALAPHCFGNVGPLSLLKTAQQLCGEDRE